MRRNGWLAGLSVLLSLATATVGCTSVDVALPEATSRPASTAVATEVTHVAGGPQPMSTSAVVAALDEFWAGELPELYGRPYLPPRDWFGYSVGPASASQREPRCGLEPVSAGVASDNAFYCRPDDTVQWDDALLARLRRDAGEFGAALVLAHEWAHVAQARAQALPGVVQELQADCFAGAWAATVLGGRFPAVVVPRMHLDQAVVAYLAVHDGLTAAGVDSHGSTFDRLGAFAQGYQQSARRCAAYPTEPPLVVPLLLPKAQAASGEQRPLEDLLAAIPLDLDRYWTGIAQLFPGNLQYIGVAGLVEGTWPCPGLIGPKPSVVAVRWCPADGLLRFDVGKLEAAWRDEGDFAVATLLGRGWAEAAAVFLTGNANAPPSFVDCLVGAWARASLATDGGDRGQF